MNKKKAVKKKHVKKKTKKNKIIKPIYILAIISILIIISTVIIVKLKQNNSNPSTQVAVTINEIIGKTAKKKYIKVQDTNGDIFYLPKGFKISENEDEQTVKNGLVIVDNTGDKQTNGSEFVWIPVKDINQIYNSELYKTIDLNVIKESTDTEEDKNIKESISTYGGFYVARYEAGISEKLKQELSENNSLDNKNFITEDTTQKYANGKYKPVSKADAIVWNYIKWGGTFEEQATDKLAGNDEANGAVKVARSMYDNSKTSVKSNLCYGHQWDAIMNFIDSNYYKNTCTEDSVIKNSSDYGNYNNKLKRTSKEQKYCQNNICDLAGNVGEWTMTGYSEEYRITRGGSYSTDGQIHSICSYREFYPSDYYKEIGFRVALWIEV